MGVCCQSLIGNFHILRWKPSASLLAKCWSPHNTSCQVEELTRDQIWQVPNFHIDTLLQVTASEGWRGKNRSSRAVQPEEN